MHELALAQAIADTVSQRADGQRITRVEVRIGHFRQVVPDSLMFSWQLLVDGTDLSDCALAVDHVPAVVGCRRCGDATTLDLPILVCGACGSSDVDLVSGEEFLIASIDRVKEVR
jgi:hydrogenase nickel incorporation protein HypA/HybF